MRVLVLCLAALTGCYADVRPTATETAGLPHPCGVGVSPQGSPGYGCPEHYACRPEGVCAFVDWNWGGPGT